MAKKKTPRFEPTTEPKMYTELAKFVKSLTKGTKGGKVKIK